jgi:hypothetical protein
MPKSLLNIRLRVFCFLGVGVGAGVTLRMVVTGNSKHL